jgi:hypothetical protein
MVWCLSFGRAAFSVGPKMTLSAFRCSNRRILRGRHQLRLSEDGQAVDVWVRAAVDRQAFLRPAVDAVMALLEDACRKSCAGVEYEVLALSPADLAAHRDRPDGYSMAALEASVRDTMCPTHPPQPSRTERVCDVLGRIKANKGVFLFFII